MDYNRRQIKDHVNHFVSKITFRRAIIYDLNKTIAAQTLSIESYEAIRFRNYSQPGLTHRPNNHGPGLG